MTLQQPDQRLARPAAQRAARTADSDRLDTRHLLLGLKLETSVALEVLEACAGVFGAITLEAASEAVRCPLRETDHMMKKPIAVAAIAVAGAITAFPATAAAQGASTTAPNCERGQLTALFATEDVKHLSKLFECIANTPPRGEF